MKHLIVVLILGLGTPAFAQTAPAPVAPVGAPVVHADEVKAVTTLLRAIHELPARERFEEVAKNPLAVLQSIAAGQGPIAERAVEAMFMWPTDQTFAIAQTQLADPATKTARKHRLLMFVAQTFKARATPLVTVYLKNADARLRITAAAAIATIRTDDAFAALDAAIAAEKSELVAAEMKRYARRIR